MKLTTLCLAITLFLSTNARAEDETVLFGMITDVFVCENAKCNYLAAEPEVVAIKLKKLPTEEGQPEDTELFSGESLMTFSKRGVEYSVFIEVTKEVSPDNEYSLLNRPYTVSVRILHKDQKLSEYQVVYGAGDMRDFMLRVKGDTKVSGKTTLTPMAILIGQRSPK
jgi:hypothetical protein